MSRFAGPATVFAVATALSLPASAGTTATPDYSVGPSNGDALTFHEVDTESGTITIFQHNSRQAGTVHCRGEGPRATLAARESAPSRLRQVVVGYTDAVMTEHPVIDVLVTGRKGRVLGHKAAHGPMYNESGSIAVPLFARPKVGEAIRVLIGLQVHAGCLPHPFVLGLAGSRPIESAKVTFPSVSMS
ncbi:MAG: hypothetical protein ACT4PP_05490 [Sporichthyaceae bacterium]